MPARHGCRKVPVAPHRVRGRLTHSPPGPSPPVSSILSPLLTLSSQLSALTLLALISLVVFSLLCLAVFDSLSPPLPLSIPSVSPIFFFTSAAVSLSLFHPVEMQPFISAKRQGSSLVDKRLSYWICLDHYPRRFGLDSK